MANDLGFPDIGLTTLQDVSTRSYLISRVTNLPTIVDIDTGFKSCKETIETFEEFGVAAVHLEDQIEQKRCGHLDNKELISKEQMVKKIKDAVAARKDKNFLIIIRTDGNTVEGLEKTIDRIKAYEDAGADIVDIGGESSRPGSQRISIQEEIDRLLPVVEKIREHHDIPISIDSMKPEVVQQLLPYKIQIINDISSLSDDRFIKILKDTGTYICLMHMLKTPETMQDNPNYDNVLNDGVLYCNYLG